MATVRDLSTQTAADSALSSPSATRNTAVVTAIESLETTIETLDAAIDTLVTATGAAADNAGDNTVIGQLKQVATNTTPV